MGLHAYTDDFRASPRLVDALTADLRIKNPDHPDLYERGLRSNERAWTDHLARQLGMKSEANYYVLGLHTTLLHLVKLLDAHIRKWKPATDHESVRALARSATSGLTAAETIGMLLAGPPEWGAVKVPEDCRVDRLDIHLCAPLEQGLTNRLAEMLARWIEWDVPNLRHRAKERAEAETAALVKKRIPPPPDRTPRAPRPRLRPEERRKEREGFFTPPGKS